MSIPKVIHYCWFGGNPLPKTAKKCMDSWKKYCPDYKIVRWDESNFNVKCTPYCEKMYNEKKWAFLSDYARLKIIYEQGGVYLDTDVELVKPLDDLLHNNCFMGIDTTFMVSNGLGLGAEKGTAFIKENLNFYDSINLSEQKTPLINSPITTDLLRKKGNLNTESNDIQNVAGVTIYPPEYFCAKHTHTGEIVITPNTYAIHHFTLSWASDEERQNTKKRWNEHKKERIKQAPKLFLRKIIGDSTVENIKRKIFKK